MNSHHRFVDASSRMHPGPGRLERFALPAGGHTGDVAEQVGSQDYDLIIRQGPERARVAGVKEKDRKPVDPPPIIQLRIRDDSDPAQNYLQSPYYFMCTTLVSANESSPPLPQQALAGTLVSSLHRLKDIDNTDGGFFVFGDLSVKVEGEYCLRFSLFEMLKSEVVHIKSITSKPFTVYAAKNFPGMAESTFLSRSFGDQGVRLRIRKEPRTLMKRPAPPGLRDEYSRQYGMPPADSSASRMPPNHGSGYMTAPREYHQYEHTKRQRVGHEMMGHPSEHRSGEYGYHSRPGYGDQQPYPIYGSGSQQPQQSYQVPYGSGYSSHQQSPHHSHQHQHPHAHPPSTQHGHNPPSHDLSTMRGPPLSQHTHSSGSSPYNSPRSTYPNQRSPLSATSSQYSVYSAGTAPPPSNMSGPPPSLPQIRPHSPSRSSISFPPPLHTSHSRNTSVSSHSPPHSITTSLPPNIPRSLSTSMTHASSPLSGPPLPLEMPPPNVSPQRSNPPPHGVYLPPLQLPPLTNTNDSPIQRPSHSGPAPSLTYHSGPPSSFDSAAQQQHQPHHSSSA
ncbi:hypothetical protein BJ508DRAFT_142889 [Ascobolus immersus RN42]|uniref:Velvet domain-containing protein n=1 Tax=Ascobolus immersus RN42 TaxID=1160509 RepID=A0A3N4HZD6_ASCIM|nr:hypothetical protein BJ508DRAFT_142889 [Ascobolus immersus RN42]